MLKKEKVLVFIGLHLTFLIAVIGTLNYDTYSHNSLLNLWYPLIIYLIGLTVYSIMYQNRAALYFYLLLTVLSMVLILRIGAATYTLLSLALWLLYTFCLEFFQVDEGHLPRFLTRSIATFTFVVILVYFIVNMLCMYGADKYLGSMIMITLGVIVDMMLLGHALYVLGAIWFLARRNKNSTISKFSSILACVLLIGAMSFLILGFLRFAISQFPLSPIDAIYPLILIPIAVGSILLEENSVIVYYDRNEIMTVALLSIFLICADTIFLMRGLHFGEKEVVIVLLVTFFGLYLFTASINYVSHNKVDNINENLYENRKTEILYQLRFQELVNNYIIFVLHQLKYNGYAQAFICTRRHAKIELFDENNLVSIETVTNYFDPIITKGNGEFSIDGVSYLVITFLNRPDEQGFLAVRQHSVPLDRLQLETYEYLLFLEKIYDLEFLKQNYKSLPGIRPQEFVIQKYHYEMNRMQQEESQYLHDVVLQKMLTIKNFLEIIEIPNVEFKEYILTEIKALNASLITHMYDLFPFTLKNLSLYECLSELITRLKKTSEYQRTAPQVHLMMNKTLKVPRYFFYPIYSIMKQLLWNIFAFSEATFVEIQLSVENNQIIIKIIDNGNRANMQDFIYEKDSRKNGILIINYEVKELNGKLFTELHYPKGSIITIKLPYKDEVNRWR